MQQSNLSFLTVKGIVQQRHLYLTARLFYRLFSLKEQQCRSLDIPDNQ